MSLARQRKSLGAHARLALLAAAGAIMGACTVATSLEPDDGPARIVLEEVGGIAGSNVLTTIDSATRAFVSYDRSRCPQPTACAAPFYKSGTLSQAALNSLFERASAPEFLRLSRDYGETRNAADMIYYSLTVAASKRAKKITADDGTMPQPMAALVNEVRLAVN